MKDEIHSWECESGGLEADSREPWSKGDKLKPLEADQNILISLVV